MRHRVATPLSTNRKKSHGEKEQKMSLKNGSKGLRVAVTGGTSGLGLALVRLLCKEGARVAFVARSVREVERTAEETGAFGIVGDIGRKDDIYPLALQI